MRRELVQVFALAGFWILTSIFTLYISFGSLEKETTDSVVIDDSRLYSGTSSEDLWAKDFSSDELFLSIPDNLWNSGFQNFLLNFQENYWAKVTLDFYWENVSSAHSFSGIDVALVAYEMLDSLITEEVHFQENLSALFHPALNAIFEQRADFLPYALDPLLTFSFQKLDFPFRLSEFSNYLASWKKKHRFAIPFLWFLKKDGLEKNNQIFAFWIDRLLQVNDISGFKIFVENYAQTLDETEFSLSFLEKSEIWSTCLQNQALCLFVQGIVDLYFGTFSDRKTLELLMKDLDSTQRKLEITSFPYQVFGYPTKLYGLVVLSGQSSPLTDQFLLDYLQLMFQDDLSLRENSFSAFKDLYDQQCQESVFCKLFTQLDLLDLWNQRVNEVLSDPFLINILQKKLDPSLFFKNTSL